MTHLAFIDTETSGLDIERHQVWELALIIEGHDDPGSNGEWVWQFPIDLPAAEPRALEINGWYTRARQWPYNPAEPYSQSWRITGKVGRASAPNETFTDKPWTQSYWETMVRVHQLTRGAHMVGMMTHFDTARIERMLKKVDMLPAWSYHLIDVESMMLGDLEFGSTDPIPWKSDVLAATYGFDMTQYERHTALGDARLARDIFKRIL